MAYSWRIHLALITAISIAALAQSKPHNPLLPASVFSPQKPASSPAEGATTETQNYIHTAWQALTRSLQDCSSIADTKLRDRPVVLIPKGYTVEPQVRAAIDACGARVETLPREILRLGDLKQEDIGHHGVLYLPYPYVVPGGRFNEMYGWDSYFIIRGLLRDGKEDVAGGMIENFFFEIDHYGAVLNANRTYYLTRSQPPFLTSMIQAFYENQKAHGREDRQWLSRAYGYALKDYELWTHGDHLAGNTGLSRYYDLGRGPVPEMEDDPHYYLEVVGHVLLHPEDNGYGYLSFGEPDRNAFVVRMCGTSLEQADSKSESCSSARKISLTEDYYKGDRAMRESGFDTSFRFGPFGGATHHFAPVCLNSLLYKMETDMAGFAVILGKPVAARQWRNRAAARRRAINKYLWSVQRGQFVDYDFVAQKQSSYDFVTTFFPLWVGAATIDQAKSVTASLDIFEKPGGVTMSDSPTGAQWDLPYGWAPMQLITVEALRRYGMAEAADRISGKFISTVVENFQRDGTIREKYNVVTRSSETSVSAGYKANVIGFGWTNGVFLELLAGLKSSEAMRPRARKE